MPARTAVNIAAAVLTGSVAVSALAGCYVDVGALQHRTSRYSVSGLVQTLVVNDHVGSVHVIGGESGRVSVTEHLTFRHTAPVATHRASAGALTLDSRCPALETCSVGYDVTVPRAVTIRVSDNVGTIRLEFLSGAGHSAHERRRHRSRFGVGADQGYGPRRIDPRPERVVRACHPALVGRQDRCHLLGSAHRHRHYGRRIGNAAAARQRVVCHQRERLGRQHRRQRHPKSSVAAFHHGQYPDRFHHDRAGAPVGRPRIPSARWLSTFGTFRVGRAVATMMV
jgi:hypothetical protein